MHINSLFCVPISATLNIIERLTISIILCKEITAYETFTGADSGNREDDLMYRKNFF